MFSQVDLPQEQSLDAITDQEKAIKENIADAKLQLGQQSIAVSETFEKDAEETTAQLGSYNTGKISNKLHDIEVTTLDSVTLKRRNVDDMLQNRLNGVVDAAQAATQGRMQTEDSAVASGDRIKAMMENAEAQAATAISAASAKANVKVAGAQAEAGSNTSGK
jgi:hypothetical protein